MNKQTDINFEMLPFAMRELVAMVIRKKALAFEDALYYIYSSDLYVSLLDANAKMWYLSTAALYETLEKEKSEKRRNENNDANMLLFKTFCIENYRAEKNVSAKDALRIFTEHDVFGFLEKTFETLHTQDIAYIMDSISTYIKHKPRKK